VPPPNGELATAAPPPNMEPVGADVVNAAPPKVDDEVVTVLEMEPPPNMEPELTLVELPPKIPPAALPPPPKAADVVEAPPKILDVGVPKIPEFEAGTLTLLPPNKLEVAVVVVVAVFPPKIPELAVEVPTAGVVVASPPNKLAFALGVDDGGVNMPAVPVVTASEVLELDGSGATGLLENADIALEVVEVLNIVELADEEVLAAVLPNEITDTVLEGVATCKVFARDVPLDSEVVTTDAIELDGFEVLNVVRLVSGGNIVVALAEKNALEAVLLELLELDPENKELDTGDEIVDAEDSIFVEDTRDATENEGGGTTEDFGIISTVVGFTAATAAVGFSLEAIVENGGVDSLVTLPSFFSIVMEVVDFGSVKENPLPVDEGLENDDANPEVTVTGISEVPIFLPKSRLPAIVVVVLKLKLLLPSAADTLVSKVVPIVPKFRLLVPSVVVSVLVPKLRLLVPPKEDDALEKLNAGDKFEVLSWLDLISTLLSFVFAGEIASNSKDLDTGAANGGTLLVVLETTVGGCLLAVVEAAIDCCLTEALAAK